MSTTQPPQTAPNTSTRQLLDELDDLMQRMLALPVQQLEDEPAAPANTLVVPTVAPPAPLNNPVTRELPPAPVADEPPPQPTPRPRSVAPAVRPPRPQEPPRQEAPPAPRPQPRSAPVPPAPAPVPRVPLKYSPRNQRPAAERSYLPAWYLQPLVWGNRTFDRCTAWFGPPGRWLRSEGGRSLLGWTGLALLMIAVAWGILKWRG